MYSNTLNLSVIDPKSFIVAVFISIDPQPSFYA